MDRRTFLRMPTAAVGVAALPFISNIIREANGAGMRFKYALCNEVFQKMDFAASCRIVKSAGFSGIEIAPFTLADHLDEISPARRKELRDIIKSEGLEFAGLHWLLVTPKGLHATTADAALRRKTWDYVLKLIDFCGDMGGGIMVFGSPQQRGSLGNTEEEARRAFADGLASVANHAQERKSTILIEPLPRKDTNVVNTLDEAVAILTKINHPAIQTMFDFHNTVNETEPMDVLVRRHFAHIRHVHINEMDGRYPGAGDLNFLPVLKVLAELKYKRWVSAEVFDFKPGADTIARETMACMRKLEAKLGS
jgi:D-psicose/D-tagatose/L-ribulose 3-epimerase